MRLGQLIRLSGLFNRKPSGPIATLQILEAVDWDTRGSGCKLQQTRLLLGVPAADTLPEVLDDLVVLCVATVVGVLLPVFDVDISNTTNQQLQLALVEHVDQIRRNELVETAEEGVELLLDTLLNAPFCNQSRLVSDRIAISSKPLTRRIRACSRL